MAEITLPRWILRARTLRGGKRPFELKPYRHKSVLPISKDAISVPVTEKEISYMDGVVGGLAGWQHWEYRFWCACLTAAGKGMPTYGICRCCGSTGATYQSRREHTTNKRCNVFLSQAYAKLLHAEKRCVVCNQFTTQQKWGVLLCSNQCRVDFMYDTYTPEALNAAIKLVEREHAV